MTEDYTGRLTPSRVLAHRASAPHAGPRPVCSCRVLFGWCEVTRHGPQEADELAGDRDDGDLGPLPIGQVSVPLMQPLLRLPRMRDHGGRLSLLPPFEIDAGLRSMPIALGRLEQDMSTVTVPRLRDRAEQHAITARVLT